MKMNDLTEAGFKFRNPFAKADKTGDAAKTGSVADDADYAIDRIKGLFGGGNKQKSDFDNLPPRVDPTDVDPALFPNDTSGPAVWRSGRDPSLPGISSPTQPYTRVPSWLQDAPSSKANLDTTIPPIPPVNKPTPKKPKKTAEEKKAEQRQKELDNAKKQAQAEADEAAHQAELAKLRKNAGTPPKADEPPVAAPKADEPPAVTTTAAVDDSAEIAKLRQELQARLDAERAASAPPPALTQKERLQQALADLDNAKTEKQINDAQAEIARLKSPAEAPTAATNTTAAADDAVSGIDKAKNAVKSAWDIAGNVPGLQTATKVAVGAPLVNTGIKLGTGFDPLGTANTLGNAVSQQWQKNMTPPAEKQTDAPKAETPAGPKPLPDFGEEDGVPEKAPEKQEESADFRNILKLAGLKPITERDITSGLTKAKPIMTLVENKNLSECGGMGMSSMTPNTPASLSINATAGSGEEVANMLASILQLAGLKQVDAGMMPQHEPMPMMKAIDIMTANPQSEMGSDMDFGDEMGNDDIEIDVVDVMPDSMNSGADDGMSDDEEKTKEGFEDATTKPNPTEMPGYGSWEQKFQRLSGDDMADVPARSGDNPLKRSPAVKESVAEVDPVTQGLFKAYEAFKNGQ